MYPAPARGYYCTNTTTTTTTSTTSVHQTRPRPSRERPVEYFILLCLNLPAPEQESSRRANELYVRVCVCVYGDESAPSLRVPLGGECTRRGILFLSVRPPTSFNVRDDTHTNTHTHLQTHSNIGLTGSAWEIRAVSCDEL